MQVLPINICITETKPNAFSLTTVSLNKCACIYIKFTAVSPIKSPCSLPRNTRRCYCVSHGHAAPWQRIPLPQQPSLSACRSQGMFFHLGVCSALDGKKSRSECRAHTESGPAVLSANHLNRYNLHGVASVFRKKGSALHFGLQHPGKHQTVFGCSRSH